MQAGGHPGVTVTAIAAGRLLLRPLRPADAGLIGLYAADARVARMTSTIPHPYPPGAAEAFVASALAGRRAELTWAMDGTPSGTEELVGLASARPLGDGAMELGYWVGPPFWNTGYASEAVTALAAHLFAAGATALVARVFDDNPGSAQVLRHAGFRPTGPDAVFSVARGETVPATLFRREAGAP